MSVINPNYRNPSHFHGLRALIGGAVGGTVGALGGAAMGAVQGAQYAGTITTADAVWLAGTTARTGALYCGTAALAAVGTAEALKAMTDSRASDPASWVFDGIGHALGAGGLACTANAHRVAAKMGPKGNVGAAVAFALPYSVLGFALGVTKGYIESP
eukprot:TRINITY_DN1192_c1_g1_i2.p1 TRINITY_DN1192_c1_g1~~TRINITY_DN1192_c1_g1_i2.p1  ORF type:complete len:158 (+),score=49.01 TRINITY_DN1192_c1_g1_i2:130-603(+)